MGYRGIVLALTIAVFNVCPWAQPASRFMDTGLPGGAKVSGLAEVREAGGARLAGTWNGRIFRTTDSAASWSRVLSGAGAPVRAFAELEDGTLLAGAGVILDAIWDCFSLFGCDDPWAGGGIYRSRDKGKTWSPVHKESGATAFAVRAGKIYAASPRGILVSSDQGATWKAAPAAAQSQVLGINARSLAWIGDTLFVFSRSYFSGYGILKDASFEWTAVREGAWPTAAYAAPWLYVSLRGSAGDTLKRSRDGGKTWQFIDNLFFRMISAQPKGLYGMNADGAFASTDGGKTWAQVAPYPGGDVNSMETFLVSGDSLFVGGLHSQGLGVRSLQGDTWNLSNRGMSDWATEDVGFADGSLYAANGEGGMYWRLDDPWSPWERSGSGPSWGRQLETWRNGLFALGLDKRIHSLDPGQPNVWTARDFGPADAVGMSMAMGADWFAVFDPHTHRMEACVQNTGSPAAIACDSADMIGFPQRGFSLSGISPSRYQGMAISGNTIVMALDTLWISDDRGGHWSKLSALPGPVSFLESKGGVFWLGGAGGLFRRTRAESIWTQIPMQGAPGRPSDIAFLWNDCILVATDQGLFLKESMNSIWTDVGEGLADRDLRSVAVDGNRLAVGLANGGVWTRQLEPTIGIRARRGLPAAGRGGWRPAGRYPDGRGGWLGADGRITGKR